MAQSLDLERRRLVVALLTNSHPPRETPRTFEIECQSIPVKISVIDNGQAGHLRRELLYIELPRTEIGITIDVVANHRIAIRPNKNNGMYYKGRSVEIAQIEREASESRDDFRIEECTEDDIGN